MDDHRILLPELAGELFTQEQLIELDSLATSKPLDRDGLKRFDASLGGPSITTIAGPGPGPGTLHISSHGVGRYAALDREVFRPLQYCAVYLSSTDENSEWMTRSIVWMASLHVEGLIKRIGRLHRFPLGRALREASVKRALDPEAWSQADRYTRVYNDAKHSFDHDTDTHRFNMQDAVLAYFVARKLGLKLYPHAELNTDLATFDH